VSQITQFLHEPLFASPVFGYELPDCEPLNRALLAVCAARRTSEQSMSISNQIGWHSAPDLFVRKEEAFRTLCAQIGKVLTHVAQTTFPAFDLSIHDIQAHGWVNINPKGAFNTPHAHHGFHWSGCYYVAVPDTQDNRSGLIEFLDPRADVSMRMPDESVLFAPKFQVRPRAGTMLIFPSFLNHWVYPNQDDDERVSVAFNARVETRAHPQGAAVVA